MIAVERDGLGRLQPVTDAAGIADWVIDGVQGGLTVGALLPSGFAVYARVLGPAHLDCHEVRWGDGCPRQQLSNPPGNAVGGTLRHFGSRRPAGTPGRATGTGIAAAADDLHAAMDRIRRLAYAILDGTLIPMDGSPTRSRTTPGNTSGAALPVQCRRGQPAAHQTRPGQVEPEHLEGGALPVERVRLDKVPVDGQGVQGAKHPFVVAGAEQFRDRHGIPMGFAQLDAADDAQRWKPGWAQPAASVVTTMTGWWLRDAGIVFLLGPIAFVVGLIEWSTHRAARQILKAARRSTAPPTTV
ncbi:hypothetical protein Acsp02_72800 [Actinoplanes sp. NBRC 103695]|nr:hypothetical protein Acsp02_72800 [Actinoplanes sp. NBRC 103695]